MTAPAPTIPAKLLNEARALAARRTANDAQADKDFADCIRMYRKLYDAGMLLDDIGALFGIAGQTVGWNLKRHEPDLAGSHLRSARKSRNRTAKTRAAKKTTRK